MTKKKRRKPFAAKRASIKYLEADAWIAGDVEFPARMGAKGFFKRDLWGFVDVIAWHPDHGFLLVQATCAKGGGFASHRTAMLANASCRVLVAGGVRIELWGWERNAKEPRRVERLAIADFKVDAAQSAATV